MMDNFIKLLTLAFLFGVWVYLVIYQVPNCADLIANIKLAITGLSVYHVAYQINPKE